MIEQRVSLGFKPRDWQAEVMRAFARFSILVVHRRGGKTLLAVVKLIHEALKSERPQSRYAYIAPQLKQGKGIAWDYIKAYARKVPGTLVNESELYVRFPNGAAVRIFGADNPDSFRGFYFDGVVLDEVAQMPINIWGEILLPALADRLGWAFFIGTPHGLNLFSELFFAAQGNPEWYAKAYSHEMTKALPADEVERMRREMTPAQFRQEMMCDFTASDDDTLIPLDDVLAAESRIILPPQYEFAPKVIGVDVAWTGGDRCVVIRRQGLMSYEPYIRQGLPERQLAQKVNDIWTNFQADACFVDVTGGYGGEVVSRLRDMGRIPIEVKFSYAAGDERFRNLRAEMWFKMATWIKEGHIHSNLSLRQELSAPRFSNDNAANKLELESKDDIKTRLKCSPDIADALALTFAYPVVAKRNRPAVTVFANGFDPLEADPFQPANPGEHNPFADGEKPEFRGYAPDDYPGGR